MNKRWWQQKKVWGTIAAALLHLLGRRLGFESAEIEGAALVILGGVSVEGIVDAVSAFGRAWKGQ